MAEAKKDVAAILAKAAELHNKGELKKAKELYEEVIKLDERNGKAHVLLGNILYYMGKGDEAEKHYLKAVEIDPDHAIAYFNVGVISQDRGDLNRAIEFYEKTIAKKTDYAQAYSNLGAALRDKGDLLGAFKNFKKAIEIDESVEVPKKEMEKIIDKVQEEVKRRDIVREAEELLMEGGTLEKSGNLERAMELYKRAIELNPSSIIAYYLLGLAYEKLGNARQAYETYKQTLDIDPEIGSKDISLELINMIENLAGASFLGAMGFSKTVGGFRDRLKREGGEIPSFKDFARKEAQLETPDYYLKQGAEKEAKGDLEGAIADYKKAIEANPKIPIPYYMLGLAFESKGEMDIAIENYKKATAIDSDLLAPQASWELSALLSNRMGGVQLGASESREILSAFRKSIDKTEMGSLGSFVKKRLSTKSIQEIKEGYLLDISGDTSRAVQKFRQATMIDPNNALAYIILGLAQESMDRPEEAMAEYRKIEQLDFSRAEREVPAEVKDIVKDYMTKTTSSGHNVGKVLARYIELVAKNPDKMLELLGYIEDIKVDSISNIIRGHLKGEMTLEEGGRIIRDEEEFPVEESAKEKVVAKRAGTGAEMVALAWKYKTARTIRCVAFDPLGRTVLAGSESGIVYHLDDRGELLRKLRMDVAVVDLDVSRDAAQAVVALQNGIVKQIDLKNDKVLWEVDLSKSGPRSVAISNDGKYIAVGLEDFNIAKISGGKTEWMRAAKGFISHVDISADGRTIVAASDDGTLYIISERMGLAPREDSIPINKPLRTAAVSPDGKYAAASTSDGVVYLFGEKKNLLWKREVGQVIYGMGVSADGRYVIAGSSNGKTLLYDRSGKLLWEYSTGDNIWSADISEDGRSIALGCGLVFGNVYLLRSAA